MLPNINLLYLFCGVLILLDLSYMSRFWTQLEAFLSLRTVQEKLRVLVIPPPGARVRVVVRRPRLVSLVGMGPPREGDGNGAEREVHTRMLRYTQAC